MEVGTLLQTCLLVMKAGEPYTYLGNEEYKTFGDLNAVQFLAAI